MNLVDKLLKADVKNANEVETAILKSKKLGRILGSNEPVEITVKEINSRRINDIIAYQLNKKGEVDYSKTFDSKIMLCVEGIVEPDLRNKDLQEHFGVSDAKTLCEKLFGSEINSISDKITELSGVIADDDTEAEIKN